MTGGAPTGNDPVTDSTVTGRTLVAGVGNIFQRDDAFGVEVARLLAGRTWPGGVEIADFGIRGIHLAYELLDGCALLILVDAAARGLAPGTVTVAEVRPEDSPGGAPPAAVMDAHGLAPDQVFAAIESLGARPGRTLLVACEPADVSAGMGLSDPVREALPHAVRAVEDIIQGNGGIDDQTADRGSRRSGGAGPGAGVAPRHQALPRTQKDVADREITCLGWG
jgi:hydrogenase maturation protease